MKVCPYCNEESPIDAVYCIMCGALFQANVGQTYKLNNNSAGNNKKKCYYRFHASYVYTLQDGTEVGPFIDKGENT